MSTSWKYSIDDDRMDLAGYLEADPVITPLNRLEQFIDAGDNLLVYTSEEMIATIAEQVTSVKPYRYFHYDVKKMYRIWKIEALRFFEKNKKLFEKECEFFGDIDTVPSSPSYVESPDFPCKYGVEWLQNIRREVIVKLGTLREAKKKIDKRLMISTIKYIVTECAIVIEGRRLHLDLASNQPSFCKIMFGVPPRTPIDWSYIYEEMTGRDYGSLYRPTVVRKHRKMVRDTALCLNKKIKEFFHIEDNVFVAKDKTIIRNF